MSTNKQVKLLLKSTKQLIQDKKFEEALPQCKDLLALEPNSYNGLVFSGLCYAELHQKEESLKAYHEAIKQNKDQFLAYQGLVNLYTKHWEAKLTENDTADLIMAYEQLIKIAGTGSVDKKSDFQLGLAKAYSSVGKFDLCLKVLEQAIDQLKFLKNGEGDTKLNMNSFYDEIIICFKQSFHQYDNLQGFAKLFSDTVKHMCNYGYELFESEEMLKLLIIFNQLRDKQLSEEQNVDGIDNIVTIVRWLMDNSWKSLLLGQCLVELYLQNNIVISKDMLVKYLESVTQDNDNLKNIYEGHNAFCYDQCEMCIEHLEKVIDSFPDLLPCRLQLVKAYLKTQKWSLAEKLSRSALQDCKRLESSNIELTSSWLIRIVPLTTLKLDFTLAFGKALSEFESSEMLNLAIKTFDRLLKLWPDSADVHMGKAKAFINLKQYDNANTALDHVDELGGHEVEVRCWKAFIRHLHGDSRTSIEELHEIVTENSDSFIAHFLLAKMMWHFDARLQNKAFMLFLKAAKLNIYDGFSFYYIGLYYRDVVRNSMKATKCFEKAYNLCPESEEIGSAMADQYVREGNLEAAISLYESFISTASSGACKWVWLRLGLCKLKNHDIEEAIKCLQASLRCDGDDYISWECLGEAYLHRGSYTSAWKAFNKAHTLAPDLIYSLYQMAAIKQVLNQFSDAILEYEQVLQLSEQYIPALKGLGESHLSLACAMLSEGRYLTCVDHVNDAIKYLAYAAVARPDLSCVWKLLGDCMTTVHTLDSSKVSINVPVTLLNKDETYTTKNKVISKHQALQLGGKFYIQALRLHDSALIWHDFGLNCFYQAQNNDEETGLGAKAIQILQEGLNLEPANHVLWNTLGAVAASKYVKNYALAQHSFIRSIQCEPNNVVAWSNLGVLYLERSQIELAHRAFKNAQSMEPSFVHSWIGQAVIAESIGSEEAMDLFRHATALGLHGQASVGYASCVCSLLSETQHNRKTSKYKNNIQDLFALSAATTQISKFCDCNSNYDWALAMHGYLLEESGLTRSAEEAYQKCLDLLTSQLCKSGASDKFLAKVERAQKNYARILFKNGKYENAVQLYRSLGDAINNYKSLCEFSVTLYAAGILDDASLALSQAAEASTTQRERSLIAIARAVLSWKHDSTDDAVESLSHHKTNQLNVLLVLLAIGVVQNNPALIQASLGDLNRHDIMSSKLYEALYENCVVISAALEKVDSKAAVCFVQKCIHRYPDDFRLRHLLSLLLSQSTTPDYHLANLSAQQSKLNHMNDSRALSMEAHYNMVSLNSCNRWHSNMLANCTVSQSAKGDHLNALKNAQRFIHCHPYVTESFSLLSAANYALTVFSRFTKNSQENSQSVIFQKFSNFIVCHSDFKLHTWAVQQNKLYCLLNGDSEDADDLSTEVLWNVLFTDGQHLQAYNMLNKMRVISKHSIEKIKLSIHMSYVAMQAATIDPSKRIDWLNKARDSLDDAGKSPMVQFLQGLIHNQQKNYKKACLCLTKVFNNNHLPPLCQSRSVAAWYLYRIYHFKDDGMLIEKLLGKWKNLSDCHMQKITNLLPY